MRTAFALIKESQLYGRTREICPKATEEDIIFTTGIDGMGSRMLKSRTDEIMAQERVSPIKSISSAMGVKRRLGVTFRRLILEGLKTRSVRSLDRQAIGGTGLRKACVDGDERLGVMTIGQVVGLVNSSPICKEEIDRIVAEAQEIIETTREKVFARD